ncbi:hypothetical protein NNJEOMEG_01847 [Fundidesulfovibrio magnetotacticus]|uniref:Uncharacterized protein n=1 Tax=Fundidesulfovibrio magnetotacticus TaxID=2730080 RepID=A0A6V8LV74_9BACT|nr:hypothetical protein [Fundidesulfovibrio magnetotacticus]GFK94009.1 hypothetical protein NNJEOMEG_01847 [Fundidesulfovibrio magnetotacticus]
MRRSLPAALALCLFLAGAALAEPVHFKSLLPIVAVTLPGWTAGTPSGSTVKQPLEASEASVEFSKGDLRLEIAVYDGGPAMAAAFAAVSQVEMETTEESVKPAGVKGYRGSLFTRTNDKEVDLVLMVAPRFAVSLHMTGSADAALVLEAANRLDLDKLAALSK